MPDAGNGMHFGTAELVQGSGQTLVHKINGLPPNKMHRVSTFLLGAIDDNDIYVPQTPHRLPQGPCRQAAAVAQTAYSIYDRNFNVTAEPIMLQTVIRYDYVAIPLLKQSPCGCYAVCPYHYAAAAAPREQDSFVPYHGRITVAANRLWPVLTPSAVTSAHDSGSIACMFEESCQPGNQRCLARSTHGNVAHDDHGNRHALHG